jgi:hypothetical protein
MRDPGGNTDRAEKAEEACAHEPYCEISKVINERVKPGERIAFRSWYRYYLRADIIQCIVSDVQLVPETVTANSLRTAGTAYILIDKLQFPGPGLPPGLGIEPVVANHSFEFYEITDPPKEPSARCIEEQPGRWRVIKPTN